MPRCASIRVLAASWHLRLKARFGQLVYLRINNHGGRIVKNTGDVLLAELPSVFGAVGCAVESNSA